MQKRFYTKDDSGFEGISGATVTRSTSKSRIVLIFLFLLIGAGLLFVGVKLLGMQSGSINNTPTTPTPTIIEEQATPVPTEVPTTPSPTAQPLTISVLNGSGVSGAAGDMSQELKKLGYTVSSTGNADAFTYTGITVKIKKSKS